MARNIEYEINVDAISALSTVGELEDNLTQLNDELRGVDRNSEAFNDLTRAAQATTRELERTNVQIAGFTSEDRVRALQGSIDVFTGGITAIAGVAGQLGLLNEDAEETIATLLSIGATASGIRTAAQGAVDLATALRGSATAQAAFNVVANANPYVLLATAVLALAAAYVIFRDDVEDARDALGDFNDLVDEELSDALTTAEEELQTLTNGLRRNRAELILDGETLEEAIQRRKDLITEIQNEQQARQDAIDAEASIRTEIEDIKDLIALYGTEDSESGLIALKIQLLEQELLITDDYSRRRGILRELIGLQSEYAMVLDSEVRPALTSVNAITERGVITSEQSVEASETNIRVKNTEADSAMGNVDAQLGALNDFANQTAVLAEESKGLAIAAVITNAAVAGIGLFRSWANGPFGAPGNAIALGASLGVLAASTGVAIDSILNADSGSTASSGFMSGPTVSTPSFAGAVATGAPQSETAGIMQQLGDLMSVQPDVLLTPRSGPGSLTATQRSDNRRSNRRQLNRG